MALYRKPYLLTPLTAIIWLLAGCVLMVDTAGEAAMGGSLVVLPSCGAGFLGEGAMNYRLITLVPVPAAPDGGMKSIGYLMSPVLGQDQLGMKGDTLQLVVEFKVIKIGIAEECN